MHLKKWMFAGLVSLLSLPALGSEQVGTLTLVQGSVKLFTNPSKTLQESVDGKASRALFEGQYYLVRDARPGQKVENGNVLRTAPGAKAWVIFDNGDQYHVGSGTAYRVSWSKEKPSQDVQLMYGKLRGVVQKGGPRSNLRIRTSTATMGVRGTDFFIAEDPVGGGTEISIIRGEVEVKPNTGKAKPLQVKSGWSAVVAAPEKPAQVKPEQKAHHQPAPLIAELRKTTQEDLKAIVNSSDVDQKAVIAPAPELAPKLQALEKKAVETTLKDIQTHDPELFAKLERKPAATPASVSELSVQKLLKEAPKAPAKRKPYKSELEDLEKGAYERYFKKID